MIFMLDFNAMFCLNPSMCASQIWLQLPIYDTYALMYIVCAKLIYKSRVNWDES